MSTYSAADVIGKTLFAARKLPVTRYAGDGAPAVFTVPAGSPVGVVFSYLLPGPGRKNLWWMYQDANGRNYYSEHLPGAYNFSALQDQGLKNQAEKAAAEEAAAHPATMTDKITDLLKWGGIAFGVFYLGATLIKEKSK